MNLETAESFSADPASPDDIKFAVSNDKQRGEFIILSKSRNCFVQAAGETEPFFVEYHGEQQDHDRAFRCKSHLTSAELEELLLRYLAEDPNWNSDYDWESEPERKWWKFWQA